MPFTARDLRYRPEQSYPLLYAYLHRNAQRFLGSLKFDAFEVDTVVSHVVEQLVRLGLLGGADHTPLTALDHLTDAQFYTFLSRSVHNKAIDRLRKRRASVSTLTELGVPGGEEEENDPLNHTVLSLWGTIPFATPEEITLHLASQCDLRNLLKHCILVLRTAPHQLEAVLQELHEIGADELLSTLLEELPVSLSTDHESGAHMSQHKDHAHKKLRHCLQQQSTLLTVMIALRLTVYGARSTDATEYTVGLQTLTQDDLSVEQVQTGLNELVHEGLLDWNGEEIVRFTPAQKKRLERFYREE
jgi:DNA-directed RNA polymerase specialized sigma24 family protein